MKMNLKSLAIVFVSLLLIYNLKTFIEYTVGFPEIKTKVNPKIQEIREIEKNTKLVQNKIAKEQTRKKEEESKKPEEEYLKSITPTKEEIEQARNVYKVLSYKNQKYGKYESIINNRYLKENKNEPDIEGRLKPGPVEVWAVDLDGDKNYEIIGFVNDAYFYGSLGRHLYVLKKIKGEYIDICYECSHKPGTKIEILHHKTNGFNDIKLYSAIFDDKSEYFNYVVQYKNGKYIKAYRFK